MLVCISGEGNCTGEKELKTGERNGHRKKYLFWFFFNFKSTFFGVFFYFGPFQQQECDFQFLVLEQHPLRYGKARGG